MNLYLKTKIFIFSLLLLFLLTSSSQYIFAGIKIPTTHAVSSIAMESCRMVVEKGSTNALWWHVSRSRLFRYRTTVGILSQTPRLVLELRRAKEKSNEEFRNRAERMSQEDWRAVEAFFSSKLFLGFHDRLWVLTARFQRRWRKFFGNFEEAQIAADVEKNSELLLEAIALKGILERKRGGSAEFAENDFQHRAIELASNLLKIINPT